MQEGLLTAWNQVPRRSEEAFAAAWEAGRALSLEDAVALALDETREG
jgi:hypothetical protein